MVETEREANHQIVQTDGKAGDEQACNTLSTLLLVAPAMLGGMLAGLPQDVDSREDEEPSAGVVADVSEQPCEPLSQEQSQDGHQRLEEAEDHPCFEPCLSIDAGESNANGGCEVAEAKRTADEQSARGCRSLRSSAARISLILLPPQRLAAKRGVPSVRLLL